MTPLEKYKSENKGNTELPAYEGYKQFVVNEIKEIKETPDGLQMDFTISTNTLDRDQDIINTDGWELKNFRANPVVLWAHDRWQPPVAKSLKEWVDGNALKSTALFMPKEISPFSHSIGKMYENGFLNAVSVGFKGIESHWSTDEDTRPWGIDYIKQELREYSCVPIPANPEALLDAKAAGIDIKCFLDYAVKCLDLNGIGMIPIETAEKIYNVLKTKSTFLIPKTGEHLPNNFEINLKTSECTAIDYYKKQIQLNENIGRNS